LQVHSELTGIGSEVLAVSQDAMELLGDHEREGILGSPGDEFFQLCCGA
jgi:hypothetical protein